MGLKSHFGGTMQAKFKERTRHFMVLHLEKWLFVWYYITEGVLKHIKAHWGPGSRVIFTTAPVLIVYKPWLHTKDQCIWKRTLQFSPHTDYKHTHRQSTWRHWSRWKAVIYLLISQSQGSLTSQHRQMQHINECSEWLLTQTAAFVLNAPISLWFYFLWYSLFIIALQMRHNALAVQKLLQWDPL